jgi:AcrR family transcriptional regulator
MPRAELLRSGRTTPGASEIAEAADVSRRTVYQYFLTVGQLLLDAPRACSASARR